MTTSAKNRAAVPERPAEGGARVPAWRLLRAALTLSLVWTLAACGAPSQPGGGPPAPAPVTPAPVDPAPVPPAPVEPPPVEPGPPPPAATAFTYSGIAPQPANVSEAQGEVVGGRLFVLGGFDSRRSCCTPTNRAQVYDPARNTWTPLNVMPGSGATHAGMTTDGTRIYYAGGYVGRIAADGSWSGQIFGTRDAWAYDPATGSYAALPDLPVQTSAGQLEYLNGNLHLFGGTNPARTQDLGDHYVLKAGARAWTPAAPLPVPRHHMGSAVLGGKLYAIGGQVGHDAGLVTQSAVHVYDPAVNAWTPLAPLPRARSHIGNSTFVLGGRIVVAGGETGHDVPMSDVTAYDPATDTWTALSPLPLARASAVAGAVGTGFVFTGGASAASGWRATPGN